MTKIEELTAQANVLASEIEALNNEVREDERKVSQKREALSLLLQGQHALLTKLQEEKIARLRDEPLPATARALLRRARRDGVAGVSRTAGKPKGAAIVMAQELASAGYLCRVVSSRLTWGRDDLPRFKITDEGLARLLREEGEEP